MLFHALKRFPNLRSLDFIYTSKLIGARELRNSLVFLSHEEYDFDGLNREESIYVALKPLPMVLKPRELRFRHDEGIASTKSNRCLVDRFHEGLTMNLDRLADLSCWSLLERLEVYLRDYTEKSSLTAESLSAAFEKITAQAELLSSVTILIPPGYPEFSLADRISLVKILSFSRLPYLTCLTMSDSLFSGDGNKVIQILQSRCRVLRNVSVQDIDQSRYDVLDMGWDDVLFHLRQTDWESLQSFHLETQDGQPFWHADAAPYLKRETKTKPWPTVTKSLEPIFPFEKDYNAGIEWDENRTWESPA